MQDTLMYEVKDGRQVILTISRPRELSQEEQVELESFQTHFKSMCGEHFVDFFPCEVKESKRQLLLFIMSNKPRFFSQVKLEVKAGTAASSESPTARGDFSPGWKKSSSQA